MKTLTYFDKDGNPVVLDEALARKVLSVVDKGLIDGMGNPVPGQMCVEAAVAHAMGQAHTDNPTCVHSEVRSAKIQLNDTEGWTSNKARARGLRAVAVAQLGSNIIDSDLFVEGLRAAVLKQILLPLLKERKASREVLTASRALDFKSPAVGDFGNTTNIDLYDILFALGRRKFSYMLVETAVTIFDHFNISIGNKQLTQVADCILTSLRKAKSPGVRFVGLCNPQN